MTPADSASDARYAYMKSAGQTSASSICRAMQAVISAGGAAAMQKPTDLVLGTQRRKLKHGCKSKLHMETSIANETKVPSRQFWLHAEEVSAHAPICFSR